MKLSDSVRTVPACGLLITLLLMVATGAVGARSDLVMQPAPDFALKTLGGKNLRLSEYRGDVVLLSFWASWCGRCQHQLPVLGELNNRYENTTDQQTSLQVLSINLDKKRNRVNDMVDDLGIDFPILMDDENAVAELYDLRKMPLLVLIDPHGKVRWIHQGHDKGDAEQYQDQVTALLAE